MLVFKMAHYICNFLVDKKKNETQVTKFPEYLWQNKPWFRKRTAFLVLTLKKKIRPLTVHEKTVKVIMFSFIYSFMKQLFEP